MDVTRWPPTWRRNLLDHRILPSSTAGGGDQAHCGPEHREGMPTTGIRQNRRKRRCAETGHGVFPPLGFAHKFRLSSLVSSTKRRCERPSKRYPAVSSFVRWQTVDAVGLEPNLPGLAPDFSENRRSTLFTPGFKKSSYRLICHVARKAHIRRNPCW